MSFSAQEMVEKTRKIVAPWKEKKGGLIPILQEVQKELGYISSEAMETISKDLKIPKSEIYGVVTFYAQFHLKPRGRHVVRVCRGTACHVRGSLAVLEKVKEITGIRENETTDDLRFTLEPVACLVLQRGARCGDHEIGTTDGSAVGATYGHGGKFR